MRRNLEEGNLQKKGFWGVYSFRELEPSDDDMSIFRGSMAAAGSHGPGRAYILRQMLGEESSENKSCLLKHQSLLLMIHLSNAAMPANPFQTVPKLWP